MTMLLKLTRQQCKKVYCIFILVLFFVLPCSAQINKTSLAILVNINDPESVEIAKYYQQARGIADANVIFLDFKYKKGNITPAEFNKVEAQLKAKVPNNIQAYVLAWRKPWRVGCMSITSAFSLGFNKEYCAQGCKTTKPVKYFNSQSKQPFTDFKIRPSMMLAAGSKQGVIDLIDRGVRSDNLNTRGSAYLLSTSDKQRNVRAKLFPEIARSFSTILNVNVVKADAIQNKTDVLFYFTGLKKVKKISSNTFVDGAVADHLTSTGGRLFNGSQMSVLRWIDAGATGTYGTVVEPCNFVQKFSNPGILMQHYLSGSTLLEAYWKSVNMPGQGVFVGEPLARPFKGCSLVYDRFKRFRFIKNKINNYVEAKSRNCG